MTEIRIYVEGGGDGANGKAQIRRGFGKLLEDIRNQARAKRCDWSIVACGSRNDAFDNFKTSLRKHPHAFNILLVDSEEFVSLPPWQHLQQHDGWAQPRRAVDDCCHLMVVMMEAWFVADIDAMVRFYGSEFNLGSLPKADDVETIHKSTLESTLRNATRQSKKGEYHKIRHAAKLLELLNVDQVGTRAKHFQRLRSTLAGVIRDA